MSLQSKCLLQPKIFQNLVFSIININFSNPMLNQVQPGRNRVQTPLIVHISVFSGDNLKDCIGQANLLQFVLCWELSLVFFTSVSLLPVPSLFWLRAIEYSKYYPDCYYVVIEVINLESQMKFIQAYKRFLPNTRYISNKCIH